MSSEVRAGVVGAGWWSTAVHLPAIVAHRDSRLVAIADLDRQKAERAAAVFGAEAAVATHEELLELGVDAVVVATPHDAHFEPTRAALSVGADVLVEKPMVLRVAEAAELIRVADQNGARLHVGYTRLHTRHVQHLKAAVATGALGDVALATGLFVSAMRTVYDRRSLADTPNALFAPDADTYASPARGGGQALSQLTHAIALLLYVLDAGVGEIVSLNETNGYPVDVTNAVAFRADAETLVSVVSTGIVQGGGVEQYHLLGSAARAHLDAAAGTLTYVNGDVVDEVAPLSESEIYPSAEPVNRLIDCRLDRAEILVPGDLGLRVTTVLAALSTPRSTPHTPPLAPAPN